MPFPAPKAKGPQVQRPNLPGNPRTGGLYPKAMEQGRMLEQSIGDAINEIKQVKKDMMDKVQSYIDKAMLAIDAQLPDTARPAVLAARVVKFIKKVKEFIQDVQNMIQAIQACISELMAMIEAFKSMIQDILNALANLLKELCNWSLPDLPALPNLFGPFLNFNGFNLGHIKFPSITAGFSFNFSLSDCSIKLPDLDIFRNQPKGALIDIGGIIKFHVPDPIKIPWNGHTVTPGDKSLLEFLKDNVDIKKALDTKDVTPFFLGPIDPALVATGSLPNPEKVISNFILQPDTYKKEIGSVLFPDLVPTTDDRDYNDAVIWDNLGQPDILGGTGNGSGPGGQGPGGGGTGNGNGANPRLADRVHKYRETLRMRVNLGEVYDSKFHPNVVAAWLFWADMNRISRKGVWVIENEEAYQAHLLPSLKFLETAEVPYRKLYSSETVENSPQGIPFVDYKNKPEGALNKILWRLSFVEAGLLGIPRNTRWDKWGDDPEAVPDFTRVSLSGEKGVTVIQSPVGPINLSRDKAWEPSLARVISKGAINIEEHQDWRTSKPQYRFIYDEFANVLETDRFTQFWKEFQDRWSEFLTLDPVLQSYLVADWRLLDGAINPLGDVKRYEHFMKDWASKDKSWWSGEKILRLPIGVPLEKSTVGPKTPEEAGWDLSNVPMVDGQFDMDAFLKDPSANKVPILTIDTFLARPDVRQMPIPYQTAMLDLNLAYVSAMQIASTHLTEANKMLANAKMEANSLGLFVKMITDNRDYIYTNNRFPGTVCDLSEALPGGGSGTGTGTDPGDPGTTPGTPASIPGVLVFKSSTQSMKKGSVVRVDAKGTVTKIDPKVVSNDPPYYDGVTITTPTASGDIEVVTVYGSQVTISGMQWKAGDLLYVSPSGELTNDYNAVISGEHWLIVIGRATGTDKFVYEPHIPFNTLFMPN